MSNELKPCPFCGSEVELLSSHFAGRWCVHPPSILCSKCQQKYEGVGVSVSKGSEVEREEFADSLLVSWWNTRHAEDALNYDLKALNFIYNKQTEYWEAEIERLKEALTDMCEMWSALGKQIPPVLGEQKYIRAKNLLNAPYTNSGSAEESKQ